MGCCGPPYGIALILKRQPLDALSQQAIAPKRIINGLLAWSPSALNALPALACISQPFHQKALVLGDLCKADCLFLFHVAAVASMHR